MEQEQAKVKKPQAANGKPSHNGDGKPPFLLVDRWLTDKGVDFRIKEQPDDKGRTVYLLKECPFDSSHVDPDACIMQAANGQLSAKCFHNGCSGHGWAQFRDKIGKPEGQHYDPATFSNRSKTKVKLNGSKDSQDESKPAEADASGEFTDTDVANGRRFVKEHGANIRYVADWKRWAVWEGKRWVVDNSETIVQRLAKETTDLMAREAADCANRITDEIAECPEDDKKQRKKLGKTLKKAHAALNHAKQSQDAKRIRAMVEMARSEPAVNIQCGRLVFDTRRDLLNVQNGTIELRLGTLRPHRREDYHTKICPVAYRQDAPRGDYKNFLKKVFHGQEDIAEYVRQFSDYIATGETSDHSFHVFHGSGSNGKSVLVLLWSAVLGEEYVYTAPADLLVNDAQGSRHPTEKVGLRGARLAVCSETKQGGNLDEATVKNLTSEDLISARGMRQDFFYFPPTHKFILQTNHKPRIKGTDEGTARRVRLVPFAVKFWRESDQLKNPGSNFDPAFKAEPGLQERLKTTEAEGILADMVHHARLFYENGMKLTPPSQIVKATDDYIKNENIIGQFFDCRIQPDPSGEVKASVFFSEFKRWAEAEGYDAKRLPGIKTFGEEAGKCFQKKEGSSGNFYRVRFVNS